MWKGRRKRRGSKKWSKKWRKKRRMMKGKRKYRRSGLVGKSVGMERRGKGKGGEKWERDKIEKEETTLVRNNQESRHN